MSAVTAGSLPEAPEDWGRGAVLPVIQGLEPEAPFWSVARMPVRLHSPPAALLQVGRVHSGAHVPRGCMRRNCWFNLQLTPLLGNTPGAVRGTRPGDTTTRRPRDAATRQPQAEERRRGGSARGTRPRSHASCCELCVACVAAGAVGDPRVAVGSLGSKSEHPDPRTLQSQSGDARGCTGSVCSLHNQHSSSGRDGGRATRR